jgi:hypothetical protein
MQFIEMSGKTLVRLAEQDVTNCDDLAAMGVHDESIVRVNRYGDIEVRRKGRWDVIGGLLGDFEHRLRKETGLDWA